MTSVAQSSLRVSDLDLNTVVPETNDSATQALLRSEPLSWRDPQLKRTTVTESVIQLDEQLTRGIRHPTPLLELPARLADSGKCLIRFAHIDHACQSP